MRLTEGDRSRTLLAAVLLVACGLGAYSNSFTDVFLGLDGKQSIRDNPYIHRIWPLSDALSVPMWPNPADLEDLAKVIPQPNVELSGLWPALTERSREVVLRPHHPMDDTPTVALRPTFSLSLALTNRFVGSEPPAHHAVNLAIHMIAAWVLFGIVRRTLRLQQFRQVSTASSTWLALAAALIWLVHPLQTESVTYLVQRAESLMGLLMLLTVYCAIRAVDGGPRFWWQVAAIVACVLGAGSKQTAVFTPLLVLLYDYTFFSRSRTKWLRPIFYVLLAAPLWIVLLTHGDALNVRFEPVRYLAYALAQPAVVLHYLRLTIWPDHLFLYVNTSVFEVRSAAQVLVPTAILVAAFVATIYAGVRRHWLGFIGGWFFIALGPTSSFFDATDLIQEHRMYVPLAALAVLAVVAADAAVGAATPRLSERRRTAIKAALLAVVVLALGLRTYARNWDYHSEFGPIHPADVYGDYTILADHYLATEDLIEAEAERARATLRAPDVDAREVPFAHFIISLAHARNGELQEAKRELERVVELEPDYAYAHYHLGNVLRELDDLAPATAHYRTAIRLDPSLVYAYKGLALALAKMGDTAAAAEHLRQALRIQPGFAEGHYELGILALAQGDRQSAAEHFERAVLYQPDLVDAHIELGTIRMEDRDFAGARRHLETVVRLRPDSADAHGALSMALLEGGQVDAAFEHANEAVDLDLGDAEAHHDLGLVLRARGESRAAAEHFETAISLRPDMAQAYHDLGLLLADQGDLAGATERFQQALEIQPDLGEAHTELGMIALKRDERREAAQHFRRAVRDRPGLVEAHYELAKILMDDGDVAGAREHLAAAVRLRPQFAEAHQRLAMALFEEGDVDAAYEHAAGAVRLEPGNAETHHDLGIVLSARGDARGATESFAEAIRLRPDFAEAHYELGILKRDQGDLEHAIENLETAVRLKPDFAQAHYDLGQVLRDRGEPTRAAEHLRRAAELDPDLVEANEADEP